MKIHCEKEDKGKVCLQSLSYLYDLQALLSALMF